MAWIQKETVLRYSHFGQKSGLRDRGKHKHIIFFFNRTMILCGTVKTQ